MGNSRLYMWVGAKGDWDFWISDLVKTDGTDLTPVVKFGAIWRAIAKSTVLTSMLGPVKSFQTF